MTIRLITPEDKDFVMGIDTHVDDKRYDFRVYTESGYVILDGETRIGTMFHTVLWDNLPFLNFICICKEYRNQGFGTKAIPVSYTHLRAHET